MSPYVLIALAGSLASILLALIAKVPTYRVAPLFLIPIIWLGLALRRRLNIHPFHYALFVLAVLLHNLGALGWYQAWPLGFSFDIVVHFYFGLVAGLLIFRAVEHAVPALQTWQVYLATFLFVMGCGAIHELIEYVSTLILGEEKGMLKTTGYKFDTQRDLLNNLLGVTLALTLMAIWRATRVTSRPAPSPSPSPSPSRSPEPA